ncbi:MATE family drug/sodium antiporter [Methanosarcina siciliae T4/M]|uniref:MATE family drug/sodium antiporter n=2 Tax=Methanosarcina siciliae TaxID=38027 RepID=A0A0E3PDJ0_9EURY|nr:MATE family efflux transporter [Methanosarcina siciliae]AKB27841.1 MATE family drug/sodium antiporter [Methanosarcina siciliae T4/M]AKB31765.1 MATE family drug/sodium antiporter [Methanosarcina siciliae HI350]
MYSAPAEKTDSGNFPEEMNAEGVEILSGDPKKAIIKLSVPMIVAMSVQTVYQLVDTYWVSGLGADALAAMGFVFPFFFISMALSNGLGIGGGSAISRRIGARDKAGADNVAVHTIVMMMLLVLIFTIPFYVFAPQIFSLVGAGQTTYLAVAYARVIFLGSLVVFFTNVANAILRAEGDSKRAMQAMVLGAALNIVLDPIFIYTFNMGIAGAAWATLLSLAVSSLMMLNWLFLRKDTFVSFNFKDFSFEKDIVNDIFRVTIPASTQQLSMSLSMLILNLIIVNVSNTDGVAVYSTGWRVATIAIAPLIGIATAMVSVSGAAFGAKEFEKAKTAHTYAIKLGLLIESGVAVFTFIFAPQIAAVFTQTEDAAHIAPDLVHFLRVICIFYPSVSLGMLSTSFFQGAGKGMNALTANLLRTIVFTPLFAALFAFTLNMGQVGAWWGIVIGNGMGAGVTFVWARLYLSTILKTEPLNKPVEQGF